MPHAELENLETDHGQEAARLAALACTGILDTDPETSYDVITRLTAQYFHAESAGIGFADDSRIWIKSHWGPNFLELPRRNSIFELVSNANGPVVVPDISSEPELDGHLLVLRHPNMTFVAGAPVRCPDGRILGVLTVFADRHRTGMTADEVKMLE